MKNVKLNSKKPHLTAQKSKSSTKKQTSEKPSSEELQEPTVPNKVGSVTLGKKFELHLKKYENADEKHYVEFSRRTAQKVTISRHDTFLCEKLGIYNIAHLIHVHATLSENVNLNNPEEIIEDTQSPYELAKMWLDISQDAAAFESKETLINQFVWLIKKDDFERFGDKNHINSISKRWFSNDTLAIDVKAQELSEMAGFEITVDDIIEFIKSNKPGEYQNPMEKLKVKIEDRFKELFGFGLKDYYAHHLVKSCEFKTVSLTSDYPF